MNDTDYPVAITIGGMAWDHLRYTSPGCLKDHELDRWGYEPTWAGDEFVRECREAVLYPKEILSAGEGQHLVLLLFPTHHHAEAVLLKLHDVGHLRMIRVWDTETREEGRALAISAARGFDLLQKFRQHLRKG